MQAIAAASAKGQCNGSEQADAQILAAVGAQFNDTAQCELAVKVDAVNGAIAKAAAAGVAAAVRMALATCSPMRCLLQQACRNDLHTKLHIEVSHVVVYAGTAASEQ
jgi:hypothetical protein